MAKYNFCQHTIFAIMENMGGVIPPMTRVTRDNICIDCVETREKFLFIDNVNIDAWDYIKQKYPNKFKNAICVDSKSVQASTDQKLIRINGLNSRLKKEKLIKE